MKALFEFLIGIVPVAAVIVIIRLLLRRQTRCRKPLEVDLSGDLGFLTPRGRELLSLSKSMAANMGHSSIRGEHVLLAILELNKGVAAAALRAAGVDTAELRKEAEDACTSTTTVPTLTEKDIEFSASIEKSLSFAVEEARLLNYQYVGTEHVLIGLLKTDESVQGVLETYGIDAVWVREQVLAALDPNYKPES